MLDHAFSMRCRDVVDCSEGVGAVPPRKLPDPTKALIRIVNVPRDEARPRSAIALTDDEDAERRELLVEAVRLDGA